MPLLMGGTDLLAGARLDGLRIEARVERLARLARDGRARRERRPPTAKPVTAGEAPATTTEG